MKNSADQRGCYSQRSKAEVDITLRDLQNSSYPTKAEVNNCSVIHSKYLPVLKIKNFITPPFVFALTKNNTTSCRGFRQWFNNLQQAALLSSF